MNPNYNLDEIWEWMQTAPRLQKAKLNFKEGFFFDEEDYKYDIYDAAQKVFEKKIIKDSQPGNPIISKIAIKVLKTAKMKSSGILVDWRAFDKLEKNGTTVDFDRALKHLIGGPKKDDYISIFDDLMSPVNSNFQIAAFLFFIQDRQRFLPISQERFDLALKY